MYIKWNHTLTNSIKLLSYMVKKIHNLLSHMVININALIAKLQIYTRKQKCRTSGNFCKGFIFNEIAIFNRIWRITRKQQNRICFLGVYLQKKIAWHENIPDTWYTIFQSLRSMTYLPGRFVGEGYLVELFGHLSDGVDIVSFPQWSSVAVLGKLQYHLLNGFILKVVF